MIQNKYFKFFIGLLIVIFLFLLFAFFILNTITGELEMGNAFDFLKRAGTKVEEYRIGDFGHQIGEVVEDPAYGGRVVKVDPVDFQSNGQNYVNIGPEIFLFPGRYRLTYDIAIASIEKNEDFAVLDIFRLGSGVEKEVTLNSSNYSPGIYKKETVEFETDGGRKFEFRILYLGKEELRVGNAILESLDKDYGLLFKRSLEVIKKNIHPL